MDIHSLLLLFREKLIAASGVTLLALTLIFWGNTLWILAKAQLAQHLIKHSWEQTLADGKNHKPWPWADTWPVAKLTSPKTHTKLYVLAGSSGSSLAFGPGHIDGTAIPGEDGSIVLSGHRDTHFRFIKELKNNDSLKIQDKSGETKTYTITTMKIIDSSKQHMQILPEENALHLVTCYPFNAISAGGPLRFIVTALYSTNPEKRINITHNFEF